MNKFIPYSTQEVTDDDKQAVARVLSSDFLTQGPEVENFESDINKWCGSNYSLAVNSASSGLHLACVALKLGEGDYLWTSPNTFVASANAALHCGAKIDFVDINKSSYNLCEQKLEEKLKAAAENKKLPKIVMPVHYSGQPCNMAKIYELSKIYNFKIIEDASHALGATYNKDKIGSCKFSDITVFSLHPVKIITSGEGGIITTNCNELFTQLKLLRSNGITRNKNQFLYSSHDDWFYEQHCLGYNYRMSDINAALGRSQLKRLKSIVDRRKFFAKRYNQKLKGLPIILPFCNGKHTSSNHLYPIKLDSTQLRKKIFYYLRSKNIGVNVHYIPVHWHPFYRKLGFSQGQYINSEEFYGVTLSLPIYANFSIDAQDYVVNHITKFFDNKLYEEG